MQGSFNFDIFNLSNHGDLEKTSRLKFFCGEATVVKGRVQCFSMQVVMNKCFLLNPKIFGADPSCPFRENRTL